MEENLKLETTNRNLKILVGVMFALLVASMAYIFKLSNQVTLTKVSVAAVMTEKEKVIADLTALKINYDQAIAEKTSLSDELVIERDKVIQLIEEVKRTNGSISALAPFKEKYSNLNATMKTMVAQVEELTKKNIVLTSQRDSTITVLGEEKKSNATLSGQNAELSKTIEAGSKLLLFNLKANAFRIKSSGQQQETYKASKTDALKISFNIAENKITKPINKDFYVQVIDPANNILGEKKSTSFEGKSLEYSFLASIKYVNKQIEVSEFLPGKDFVKGTYVLNVYDKNEIVTNSTFTLK